MEIARPCVNCGPRSEIVAEADYDIRIYCGNCYDADCVGDSPHFVSRSIVGSGMSLQDAIRDWNEQVDDNTPEAVDEDDTTPVPVETMADVVEGQLR